MSITFTVGVDWGGSGSLFTDESANVRRVQIRSGFERPGVRVADVGRCTITLDNSDQRFSPEIVSGKLYGDLVPRRGVRVQASDGGTTWTLFRGYIETIRPMAGEYGERLVVLECVDGMALLARQAVGVAHEDTKDADAAVSAVVAAAYTPPATSYADNGDVLEHYGRSWEPERTTARDALREICQAVYGRFWVARDGTATYWSRTEEQDPSKDADLVIGDYWERVAQTQIEKLLGYWRLNESSGASVGDTSAFGHDGVATGVTWAQTGIGDGDTAAGFDGVNDYVNLYRADLAARFGGSEGTLLVWAKIEDGQWSSFSGRWLARFYVDGSNYVECYKVAMVNSIAANYCAGGTAKSVSLGGMDTVDWMCLALTWSASDDEFKFFIDGEQVGSTQTGLGSWAGTLAGAYLGAYSNRSFFWYGDLAHVALWDTALTEDEIAYLAEVY